MDEQRLAERVVEKMMAEDAFSRWLGIRVEEVKPGFCKLTLEIREEMTNGFNVSHGGIAFSLADSALAFASNTYGRVALTLENNISYHAKVTAGDRLIATTTELHKGHRTSTYGIEIMNQNQQKVATSRGTVYITSNEHLSNN